MYNMYDVHLNVFGYKMLEINMTLDLVQYLHWLIVSCNVDVSTYLNTIPFII